MHETLEEAGQSAPVDVDRALSDGELKAGGLAPVKAWVRTAAGKTAARKARYRARLAESGVRQLNLQAPVALHATLRALASEAREGRDWRVAALTPQAAQVLRALERGGWRARLIGWLAKKGG